MKKHTGITILEQPVRHRRKRHRVAEHDVARQHTAQAVQADQPLPPKHDRAGRLTSREKMWRRLHPIGRLAAIGDSGR